MDILLAPIYPSNCASNRRCRCFRHPCLMAVHVGIQCYCVLNRWKCMCSAVHEKGTRDVVDGWSNQCSAGCLAKEFRLCCVRATAVRMVRVVVPLTSKRYKSTTSRCCTTLHEQDVHQNVNRLHALPTMTCSQISTIVNVALFLSFYRWEESGYFAPDDSAKGEPFTMAMPPANVTGRLHMGHAMFATLQVHTVSSLHIIVDSTA